MSTKKGIDSKLVGVYGKFRIKMIWREAQSLHPGLRSGSLSSSHSDVSVKSFQETPRPQSYTGI